MKFPDGVTWIPGNSASAPSNGVMCDSAAQNLVCKAEMTTGTIWIGKKGPGSNCYIPDATYTQETQSSSFSLLTTDTNTFKWVTGYIPGDPLPADAIPLGSSDGVTTDLYCICAKAPGGDNRYHCGSYNHNTGVAKITYGGQVYDGYNWEILISMLFTHYCTFRCDTKLKSY